MIIIRTGSNPECLLQRDSEAEYQHTNAHEVGALPVDGAIMVIRADSCFSEKEAPVKDDDEEEEEEQHSKNDLSVRVENDRFPSIRPSTHTQRERHESIGARNQFLDS